MDVGRAGLYWEHLECLKNSPRADEIVAGTAASTQQSLSKTSSIKSSFLAFIKEKKLSVILGCWLKEHRLLLWPAFCWLPLNGQRCLIIYLYSNLNVEVWNILVEECYYATSRNLKIVVKRTYWIGESWQRHEKPHSSSVFLLSDLGIFFKDRIQEQGWKDAALLISPHFVEEIPKSVSKESQKLCFSPCSTFNL